MMGAYLILLKKVHTLPFQSQLEANWNAFNRLTLMLFALKGFTDLLTVSLIGIT